MVYDIAVFDFCVAEWRLMSVCQTSTSAWKVVKCARKEDARTPSDRLSVTARMDSLYRTAAALVRCLVNA